ncbi:MBL fold metallo-hydrolase [Phytoactinopolyspora halotolerans]|uniref:MBL fold metallo-hydrolase n=1 Tax=Phytoactinopolyspora halotolerans TaxID=1981512 RepID=A0A6L9S426_9ACTN|nr:MBL fold metallo-hydrolase [Phytoactinopolyspora halotolerans]NED99217.1 MBL fold metallo-hydrolase [Phytoactinopolyspora halotolerans]
MVPEWCHVVRADNPGPMTLDGTNTYVLATDAGNVVIDPGPLIDAHLTAILGYGPVILTVLTHHHLDHSESAARFHELTGAPVRARDPKLCIAGAPLDAHDAALDVPGSGAPALELRVLHTPGHTADSICLELTGPAPSADQPDETHEPSTLQRPWRGLIAGDTVLGRGTTVVMHPDGRLGDYLASLELLRTRLDHAWTLLPAHGPVRTDAAAVITQYLEHRRARLDEVRAALASGATTPREVVEIVYADVDRSVWPAAERTVAAALEYLASLR